MREKYADMKVFKNTFHTLILGAAILTASTLEAQVLKNLNYRHLYNPEEPVTCTWEVVKENNTFIVYYEVQLTDSTRFNSVNIEFETRESLDSKSGTIVTGNYSRLRDMNTRRSGMITFSAGADQKVILAKVTVSDVRKPLQFLYHKTLTGAAAVYGKIGTQPVTRSYINHQQPVTFTGFQGNTLSGSYYENSFPAAAPAYSIAQARVPKILKPDSLFTINSGTPVTLSREGLYLVQQDTASAQGVVFRLEDDYPRLGKLESLAGPLVYICTKAEYDKIKTAGSDKKKFDQVILGITGNSDRARIFMRNYFRRVEAANQYFSSYKEGWKTDRGMIYIIYGVPDEVYLFDDREVWEYKNSNLSERFQFVKSATIFDRENYVLIRTKGYADDWYNMIDLWRKARF